MPEIPIYANGLPPKAGGVPDMPLDREGRGRVQLGRLGAQARETGQQAAESILAGRTPLMPADMYSGLERGQQRLALGLEHLGGVMSTLATRQQEVQNYLDLSRADQAMQETYAAHLAARETMDPREWKGDLDGRLKALPSSWQGNDKISPAAQQRIMERFGHFSTMRAIETQAQVTGAVAQEARGVIQSNVMRAVDQKNIEGVKDELAKGVALHVIEPGRAAVEAVQADRQIRAKEIEDLHDRVLLVAKDPARDAAPVIKEIDAMVSAKRLPEDQANLWKQGLQSGQEMKETQNLAAVNPWAVLDMVTKKDGEGKEYLYHPEWPESLREQHEDAAHAEIARRDRIGTDRVQNGIVSGEFRSGNEIRKTMTGQMSPAQIEGLAQKLDGSILDEGAYASAVKMIYAVDVARDMDPASKTPLLQKTRLENVIARFPAAAEKNLRAMLEDRYSGKDADAEDAIRSGVKTISEMFQNGQFGAVRVPVVDPKTGRPMVTRVEKYTIPETVSDRHWYQLWLLKNARPGTAEDALKGAFSVVPVTEAASAKAQGEAFNAYQNALNTFLKNVRNQKLTDPAKIMEEVNKATSQGRLKIFPSVTPSVADPRDPNNGNSSLFPPGLGPSNSSPDQLRARNDELIRKYGGK